MTASAIALDANRRLRNERSVHRIVESISSELALEPLLTSIVRHACELLDVTPQDCIYLDDLGINLKPARAMGMRTIKVGDPDQAIAELEAMVGIPLRG